MSALGARRRAGDRRAFELVHGVLAGQLDGRAVGAEFGRGVGGRFARVAVLEVVQ